VKKKTAVILVVVASCILVFGFFGLVLVVAFLGGDGVEFQGFGPRVAVVEVYGQIGSSQEFVRQIKRWTDDGNVKAIVLDIDSPGGAVAPSQEMYEQVLKARAEGKVVVAAFRSVAASGGYYIACAADKIVSNPGTLTGSIGVILSFPTAKKLFEKIGLRWETVKSGELKDVGNWSRPMTPEEERMLKAVIDDTYEQFVEAVSNGRDRPKEEIYPLSDGSIFTGRQAYNFGLVDTLGTFEDAVSIAGEMAGIGPDPDVVRERKRKPGLMELLYGGLNLADKITDLESHGPTLMYLYE
jgi:protease-4